MSNLLVEGISCVVVSTVGTPMSDDAKVVLPESVEKALAQYRRHLEVVHSQDPGRACCLPVPDCQFRDALRRAVAAAFMRERAIQHRRDCCRESVCTLAAEYEAQAAALERDGGERG